MKNRQLVEKIKEEGMYLITLIVLFIIIFKMIFYKENTMVVIRMVFSLFYLIVLPGYFIMIYWVDKMEFKERVVLGVVAGTVVIGIISYYLGLVGLNVKYHFIPLPLFVIIGSTLLFMLSGRD